MKKIIMITLIIAMALFATSCGAQKSIPIQNNDDPISPQPTTEPTQNVINDANNNDYITDDNKDVGNIENNQEQHNNDNDNDNNTEEITEITESNDYITDDNKNVDNIENNQEQYNNDNDNYNNTEEITEITESNDYITDDNKDVGNIENNKEDLNNQEQHNNDNDNDSNTEEITEITEDNIEIIKNDDKPKEDNRKIIAISKINKLIEARRVLLQQNKPLGNCVQYDIENLSIKFVEFPGDCVTKDDYWITSNYAFYAVGATYYYNYVNNNIGYYDFFDWISEQPSTDYILKTYKISKEYGRTTDDLLMLEAIRLAAFLDNCEEIKMIDLVETDKYTISGIKSSYIINLECDGIKGLFAVFDKNDNLLNICSSDDWDYYISSFPNGFDFR